MVSWSNKSSVPFRSIKFETSGKSRPPDNIEQTLLRASPAGSDVLAVSKHLMMNSSINQPLKPSISGSLERYFIIRKTARELKSFGQRSCTNSARCSRIQTSTQLCRGSISSGSAHSSERNKLGHANFVVDCFLQPVFKKQAFQFKM